MRHTLIGVVVGAAVAMFVATSSCSIQHRSDQYACASDAECSDGRVCHDGFCIVAGSLDAPRGDARGNDANNCPAPCTSCNVQQKSCTINCATANCDTLVTCPAGYRCDVLCAGENACRKGINCQQAASCNIECSGRQSCEGIVCGPGPCDVGCIGPASCRDVVCGNSCACDVVCTGNQSCQEGIVCTSFACDTGSGCTSVPALCHSCN